MYYLCSENKEAGQLCGNRRFSQDVHITLHNFCKSTNFNRLDGHLEMSKIGPLYRT